MLESRVKAQCGGDDRSNAGRRKGVTYRWPGKACAETRRSPETTSFSPTPLLRCPLLNVIPFLSRGLVLQSCLSRPRLTVAAGPCVAAWENRSDERRVGME